MNWCFGTGKLKYNFARLELLHGADEYYFYYYMQFPDIFNWISIYFEIAIDVDSSAITNDLGYN